MNDLGPGLLSLIKLTQGHPRAIAALRELRKFQNGIDNILAALKAAPSLPIETCSIEDQAKWTDILTSILMALGTYEATGKPRTMAEELGLVKEP